jgi:excisionase family DNA binding protein
MQACDYTSLSVSTLRRAVDRGRLKVSKEAGKLMFRREWLDKWLGGK